MWDSLWVDLRAVTLAGGTGFGLVDDAAIGVSDGQIAWVGPRARLPGPPERLAEHVHACGGNLATPGLIDCHTHIVYGGNRSNEFAQLAEGMSYASIHAAGGGIRSTVAATRALDEQALVAASLPRAQALVAEGVTTLEIKSGYGGDVATELRMLHAARQLGEVLDVEVVPTLLALHALPDRFARDRAGYLDLVTRELLPEAASGGLARAVDVFCEGIAFSVAECAQVLEAAAALGLAVHVHADQLSPMGAAELAARFHALSADHLEYTGLPGISAMAQQGTTAVLLPGAFLVTGETRKPPVAQLRAAGVPIAIATDCNPGSSPCISLTVTMALARTQFGLTAAEALGGVTREAARALGLLANRGTLEAGKCADFCLWQLDEPHEFGYWLGSLKPRQVVREGRLRG
jgi:imidazolonepropionase